MYKREAKDICEKYLSVPATTNFGIMFVPFEGLYAEVVSRSGLIETLGRDYHVNVAGPSTMAAILNSLQMSYQTFRLQKRTDDVLRVLSAVKAELPRYQKALRRAQQQQPYKTQCPNLLLHRSSLFLRVSPAFFLILSI